MQIKRSKLIVMIKRPAKNELSKRERLMNKIRNELEVGGDPHPAAINNGGSSLFFGCDCMDCAIQYPCGLSAVDIGL